MANSELLVADRCEIVSSEEHELYRQKEKDCEEEQKEEKRQIVVSSEELKMPSLGQFNVEDDDDGFRTPTALVHKITVIQQCPPAPKKPKSRPLKKRKASSSNLQINLSKENESLLPSLDTDLDRKIKKVRGEHYNNNSYK